MTLNPFRAWLEHDARQRELDRAAMLEVVREILHGANQQASVAAEQTKLMQQFFAQFLNYEGAPESRTLRDEDEFEAEQLRWKLHQGES